MHLLHGQILAQIQRVAKNEPVISKLPKNYGGSNHVSYGLSAGQLLSIVKNSLKNKKIEDEDWKKAILSLYKGDSSEEKYAASRILQLSKSIRELVNPEDVDNYLDYLHGWAEVDSLCQLVFDIKDYEKALEDWIGLFKKLSKDENINKRRASLVLLVKAVSHSENEIYSKVAFEIIDRLKWDRDKLITKAVSWILRAMVKNHRDRVESYLVRNQRALPSIAVRETRTKLITGKKYNYPIK